MGRPGDHRGGTDGNEMVAGDGMGWAAHRAGDALRELLGPGSCSQGQEQRFRKEKKTP